MHHYSPSSSSSSSSSSYPPPPPLGNSSSVDSHTIEEQREGEGEEEGEGQEENEGEGLLSALGSSNQEIELRESNLAKPSGNDKGKGKGKGKEIDADTGRVGWAHRDIKPVSPPPRSHPSLCTNLPSSFSFLLFDLIPMLMFLRPTSS